MSEKQCPAPGPQSPDSGSEELLHREHRKNYLHSKIGTAAARAIPENSSLSGRGVALLVGSNLILARLASSGFSEKRNSLFKMTVPETAIRC